jgi:pilus assembly protein TadC
MPDPIITLTTLVPGAAASVAVLAMARRAPALGLLIDRVEDELITPRRTTARRRLSLEIERAGWTESPERLVVLTLCLAAGLAALGLSIAIVAWPQSAATLALGGASAGVGGVGFVMQSAVRRRRKRLIRELAPLLELFVLELGGGGSALSALGSVTMQIDGELAVDIRRLLIASHVSGSASFESRLRVYAQVLQIAPLAALATVLTASREYGTGVTQGVRALAADLRRAQRRELIAHSRRALNHVLFPAAIGVLLPFLAILLYPAVSTLQASLR